MSKRAATKSAKNPDALPAGAPALLLLMFFLTGGCGLVYEVVWSRLLVLVMGASTFATTTVLVAFMGGLALGSYVGGRLAHRFGRLTVVYGVLEIAVGAYALALPALLGAAEPLYRALYEQTQANFAMLTAARFGVSTLLLLVPTTLMGATLPLLVQHLSRVGGRAGASVAVLYGVNSGGAVVGAALAGFVLVPAMGMTATLMAAAAVNALVGISAILLLGGGKTTAVSPPKDDEKGGRSSVAIRIAMVAFGLSGISAMAYQVAWTRALVVTIGPHTYSFTCIVTAYILGLSLGSLLMRRRVERVANPMKLFALLEIGIAATALLVCLSMDFVPVLSQHIAATFGARFSSVMSLNFLIVLGVVLLPTLQMGAVFPLVGRICTTREDRSGRAVGRAYAVNTIGTIVGTFLAGFVLIPNAAIGSQGTLLGACALNAAVGLALLLYSAAGRIQYISPWPLVTAVALIILPIPILRMFRWDTQMFARAGYMARADKTVLADVLYYREGVDGTVAVTGIDDAVSLRVSGKVDASNTLVDGVTQLMLGHVPSVLAGSADRAMVLGLGSGMTVSALACNENIGEIDCLEISEGVIEGAEFFTETNYNILKHPRVHIIRGDGRNHLLLSDRTYGAIISEPSNPWMAGVANLFTREYYQLCYDRLDDDGWLCAWMHAYHISPEDFKMVVRTVADVFPFVSIWSTDSPDYLILACKQPSQLLLDDVLKTLESPLVQSDLERIGWDSPAFFLSHYIIGGDALRAWVSDGPLHRDDCTTLEFTGPRTLFHGETFAEQIAAELHAMQSNPFDELLVADPGDPAHAALRAAVERRHEGLRYGAEARRLLKQGDLAGALNAAREAFDRLPNADDAVRLMNHVCDLAFERTAEDAALVAARDRCCRSLPDLPDPLRYIPFSAPSLPGGPPPTADPFAGVRAQN